jgi:superfamily II DNA or RNA helicase
MPLPPADLLIFDEAHRSRGRTREQLIGLYPDANLLGMTATPCRSDGRGLGNIYETIIEAPQVQALTALDFLVPAKIFAPVRLDLKGVRVSKGDFAVGQLEQRMNTSELVGNVARDWLAHAERRRTICFAVRVAHSAHITNEFLRLGVRAEHLDGNTPTAEREAILARLQSGETEVVSNCMVLTEGFDCPDVGCIILARPTKQMGLYRQMIGRGLRPAPDKKDVVVLDHADAWRMHGRPEDHIEWMLDVDGRAVNQTQQQRNRGDAPQMFECPSCKLLITKPPCPSCGWQPKPRARDVDFKDGELGLVEGGKATATVYDPATRARWYAMLKYIEIKRSYRPKWAKANYHEKFNAWPAWGPDPEPIEPAPEVLSWVRSGQIAYAKARGAA